MRFTLVGHAGLYVEEGETDLLVDPWLFGSCYWRSWWHFPPIGPVDERWRSPRFVYLSHHHFDHFHYPSLRRLDRDAQVLVPRFAVDVMRAELAGLGFGRVIELDHGQSVALGDGLVVRSYQYGVDDSVLVIAHGSTVVADFNDCKVRGGALRQILHDSGSPTFVLKNYSVAQAYPACYRARRESDLERLSRQSYLTDFLQTALDTGARYAVPFASMTCFLHPETALRNADVILPADLVAAAGEHWPGPELVVMAPGDVWEEQRGFERSVGDAYQNFQEAVLTLADQVRPRLEAAAAEEAAQAKTLTFAAFADYFGRFVRALPPLSPLLFRSPVVFDAPTGEYWIVDLRRRRVTASDRLPKDWASLVEVPPGVLADAMAKGIVNFVHISMRIAVELNGGGVDTDFLFWGALTVWELGYLPLRHLPLKRASAVAWARRRELAGNLGRQLIGRGSSVERMAASFMRAPSQPAAGVRGG